MNKDITLEEYTIKINAILAEKGKEFTKEGHKPTNGFFPLCSL